MKGGGTLPVHEWSVVLPRFHLAVLTNALPVLLDGQAYTAKPLE